MLALFEILLDIALVFLGAFLLYLSVPAIINGTHAYGAFLVAAFGLFVIGRAATVIPSRK